MLYTTTTTITTIMAQTWTLESTLAPLPAAERGFSTVLSGNEVRKELVYTNGKAVVFRKIDDPHNCEAVFIHTTNVTCAKFSPDGKYVCSGDDSGGVKVWARDAPEVGERKPVNDIQVLGGPVVDLDWSPCGKKIVAVGDGRGKLAKCFAWDRGSNFGDFDGLSRKVNSVAYRPTAPFKVVTGSEDSTVNVYGGPPFKFICSNKKHANFVNCVRFSPDGTKFVSVSSDKRCLVYDAETNEVCGEFAKGADAHAGSVMACAWSPCGKQIATCSADKTCRLFDSASLALVKTIKVGTKVEDMQVGLCWVGDNVISLSLSGHLNYLDFAAGSVSKTVRGHMKKLTALARSGSDRFFTASYDGKVCEWTRRGGVKIECEGHAQVHTSLPVKMQATEHGKALQSVGYDDTLRTTALPLRGDQTDLVTRKLAEQPKDSDYCEGAELSCVVHAGRVEVVKGGTNGEGVLCQMDLAGEEGSSCAIHPMGSQIAVGTKSGKVLLLTLSSGSLSLCKTLERHRGEVSALRFSHSGDLLASGDANRECLVWQVDTGEVKKSRMVYHSSKITCVAWSPSDSHLATGSVDSNVIVWPLDLPGSKRFTIALAHKEGVTGAEYLSEDRIVTCGTDSCCKVWALQQ